MTQFILQRKQNMKLGGETRIETEQETERGELKETFYAGMKPSF